MNKIFIGMTIMFLGPNGIALFNIIPGLSFLSGFILVLFILYGLTDLAPINAYFNKTKIATQIWFIVGILSSMIIYFHAFENLLSPVILMLSYILIVIRLFVFHNIVLGIVQTENNSKVTLNSEF